MLTEQIKAFIYSTDCKREKKINEKIEEKDQNNTMLKSALMQFKSIIKVKE